MTGISFWYLFPLKNVNPARLSPCCNATTECFYFRDLKYSASASVSFRTSSKVFLFHRAHFFESPINIKFSFGINATNSQSTLIPPTPESNTQLVSAFRPYYDFPLSFLLFCKHRDLFFPRTDYYSNKAPARKCAFFTYLLSCSYYL